MRLGYIKFDVWKKIEFCGFAAMMGGKPLLSEKSKIKNRWRLSLQRFF